MRGYFLGFSALAVAILLVGQLAARPLPTPTSSSPVSQSLSLIPTANSTLEEKGIMPYKQHSMEHLLENNSVYIRDIVSTSTVYFDLPKRTTGFYPIILSPTADSYSNMSSIPVNSTSPVSVSLFKCGHVLPFGTIKRGHILINMENIADLDKLDCGFKWKNHLLKLIIAAGDKRARGRVIVNHKYWGEGSRTLSISAKAVIVIGGIGVTVIFMVACFVAGFCKITAPIPVEETPQSIPSIPEPIQLQWLVPPLHRAVSDVTVYEHEREEMEMERQRREMADNFMPRFADDFEESESEFSSDTSDLAPTMDFDTTHD